jgi:tetratricopeptide (TPR) repeat protein
MTDAKAKLDEKKYDEAIVEYQEYLKSYPKSDKAVFAYNQIAGIQIDGLKNPQAGIKTYTELAEKFPDTKDAKQSLFMVAFIYDETLKDKPNAIEAYKNFLAKYPKDMDANDKMSESATTMLEVLQSGKSIEQIIQENIDKMGNQSAGDTVVTKNPSKTEDKPKNEPKQVETSKPDDSKDPADANKE